MSVAQLKTLLWALPLARLLVVASEVSSPQAASSASMSDEIQKVRKLVDGESVVPHDSITHDPSIDPQSAISHERQDGIQFGEAGIPQEVPVQSLAYPQPPAFLQPMMSPYAQPMMPYSAMQEMSNLLASNRKLRNMLSIMQKKDDEAAKERAKVNEGLSSIASMAEASTKQEQSLQDRLREEQEKETNLALASTRQEQTLQERLKEEKGKELNLELANAKFQQANAELQAQLQAANTQNSQLRLRGGQRDVAEAEKRAQKAEEEAEHMASQMRAAQASMQHTKDIVLKLLPRIEKQL